MILSLGRAIAALLLVSTAALAQSPGQPAQPSQQNQPGEASPATRAANAALAASLPFADQVDIEEARRGFVASIPDGVVQGPSGTLAWDMRPYAFLAGEAPDTVNPSLWRQARLNAMHGLFRVTDRVYQLRGYDISNMTIVEGETGIIVVDPLVTTETARAALDLYFSHRPRRPVSAVIYTHSHVDHFGGVRGVLSRADIDGGRVPILAPDKFMEHAVSENVIAGNAMSRRAWFQFGVTLPPGPRGQVDTGLGPRLSRGTISLVPPTDVIARATETRTIDGVTIEFMLTPHTEAPAEMVLFFPQFGVLNMAELTNRTMHNIYTIRGAEVRDARAWSRYIAEALQHFAPRADVVISQHTWPVFGRERAADYLAKHRDLYKFIHDQTVRLMNHGFGPAEIAERLRLPAALEREWSTRGYYGTLSHNAKAVYQRYLGWYDAHPANLWPLPPVENARKIIAYMGGAEAVLAKANEDYARGDYRWVASITRELVFADPANRAARELGARALEQLGYQAEAGTWRNAFLTGAQELRVGVDRQVPATTITPEFLRAIPLDLLFDFMAVRVNADKAEGKRIVINWTFTDTNQRMMLNLENATLTNVLDHHAERADVAFTLTRSTLDQVLLRMVSLPAAIATGQVRFVGNPLKFVELVGTLDDFAPGFPIVEPRPTR